MLYIYAIEADKVFDLTERITVRSLTVIYA